MKVSVVSIRLSSLLALLVLAVGTSLAPILDVSDDTAGLLQVSFFAVGQGDAIYIETFDGVQVLIDGGPNSAVLGALAGEVSVWDRDIDVVVGTHPDLDHVAGLVDVLERYAVGTIITTEARGASPAARAWEQAVQTQGAAVQYARAGQVIQLGASTTMTVLSPTYDPSEIGSNAGSIVVKVSYGDIDFILTGDAPQGIEDYLVATRGEKLEAEVLKLGHHGSDTSSSESFLQAVDPLFAVVSAGVNNRYNHPHPDVLERVAQTQAEVVSTQTGTLTFHSDGEVVWLLE